MACCRNTKGKSQVDHAVTTQKMRQYFQEVLSFVPAVGHLPVYFQTILIPGDRPGWGRGLGVGAALLELTDALLGRSFMHLSPSQIKRQYFKFSHLIKILHCPFQ